jgi:hypothetical protein
MRYDFRNNPWSVCPHQHWLCLHISNKYECPWIVRSHRVDANTVEIQTGQHGIDIWVLAVDRFAGVIPPAKGMTKGIFSESCIDKYRIGIATALSEVMCADVLQLVARCLPSFEYSITTNQLCS